MVLPLTVKSIPENEYCILNAGEKNHAIISTYHTIGVLYS